MTLPGLTPGASAVALAQLRLALRTPRGRSILLMPLVMTGVLAVLMRRSGNLDIGPIGSNGGLGLASFMSFMSLLVTLHIAVNQFAVDKAGMTLTLLSPLSDREYLAGKAVGNALIGLPPAFVCLIGVALALPRRIADAVVGDSTLPDRNLPVGVGACGDAVRSVPAARRFEQHRSVEQRTWPRCAAGNALVRRRGRVEPGDCARGDHVAATA